MEESCKWYNQIKEILPVLQSSVQKWLPDGYVLPNDLFAWLGRPEYTVKPDMSVYICLYLSSKVLSIY